MNDSTEYPRIKKLKIADIHVSAETNPRTIDEDGIERLGKSIEKFGNIQPIVVNAKTGRLIGGHQRLQILKDKGKEEVDVWEVYLDEFSEPAASIALNNEIGEYDPDSVADMLKEFDAEQIGLTCFDDEEIARYTVEIDRTFEQGTEEISENMEMHKVVLQFDSLESKFRWDNFIDLCKSKVGHNRPATDYMFELMGEV